MGGKVKRRPRAKAADKYCASCQAPMSPRDQHDECLNCLGVDHAILAAGGSSSCAICKSTPAPVNARRLNKIRPAAEEDLAQEGACGGEPHQRSPRGDEEYPPTSPGWQDDRPDQDGGHWCEGEEEEEEEEEDDFDEVYDDEEDEPVHLQGRYSPRFEAVLRAAMREEARYRRETRAAPQAAEAAPTLAPTPPPELEKEQPPPMVMDNSDLIDIFKEAAVLGEAPWPSAATPRTALTASIYQGFGDDVEAPKEKQVLPLHGSFVKVLQSSWEEPHSSEALKQIAKSVDTAGTKAQGLDGLPPMDRYMAAHLLKKSVPRDKEPVFDGALERDVSNHIKAAYSSLAIGARTLNALSLLQISTSHLLRAMGDEPKEEQLLKLRRLHREQLKLVGQTTVATGRSMAQLVVAERSRWLNLSPKMEDRPTTLNQPLKVGGSTTSLFPKSLPDMLARREEDKRNMDAIKAYMPAATPRPSYNRYPAQTRSKPFYNRDYSRDRRDGQRPGPSGATRAPPPPPPAPAPRRRVEKRHQSDPDPSPARRGGGGGSRGARGAYAGRQRK